MRDRFAEESRIYEIDLDRPEGERWREVIAADREAAARLVQEAGRTFSVLLNPIGWVFSRLYRRYGGLYQDELQAWSDALGVSFGTVTLLNCAYELSHIRLSKLFGCTAAVRWDQERRQLFHIRCLDWPLPAMSEATRIFRFHSRARAHEFLAVSVPGQVGVLSGMVPKGYSVTINWAPPVARPSFEFGPTFLLRDTLETCRTYAEAVEKLRTTPLSTSTFFTVCGVEPGQACVIERTQNDAEVRPLADSVIVQTNHHSAPRFAENNADIVAGESDDDVFSLQGSGARADLIHSRLKTVAAPCTWDALVGALDAPPVLNADTCQQMVFLPQTGEFKLWRRIKP